MTSSEEIVRAAYRAAEGDVRDLKGWRDSFTEDGVFTMMSTGDRYQGETLGDLLTGMFGVFPDVHRELLKIHPLDDDVVAVQLLIQGTFQGPFPTPAGVLAPNGAKTSVPAADIFHLRDGKILTFDCYPMMNIRMAQMGVSFDFASAVKRASGAA
ncbi:ketosteroid isomerase-like protein [Catenulispora sp. GAS73]|uniref:nuclear transport factor 2 family protein n=1 Tax=Catenulispora sp. GAS73 TaxID=3156269 RepID=UPI003514146C